MSQQKSQQQQSIDKNPQKVQSKAEQNVFINIFDLAPSGKEQTVKAQKYLKPQPLADPKLTKKICQLLQQLMPLKQIRKGVNQILKQMTKSSVQVVILAADCTPLEIIMTLPPLCEQKNVQFCFVPSKASLGRACGIKTPVAAAAITFKEGSQMNSQILQLKDKIEQLSI